MMAVMMLGMPQVYSCHTSAVTRVLRDERMSEARVCPPLALGGKVGTTVVGDQPDPGDWKKLLAVHCQATQSVLTFTCSLDGQSRKVKFEKFRQPCGIQAVACWGAAESSRLKVGELDWSTRWS